jgi:GT2 family glycosyltransferase
MVHTSLVVGIVTHYRKKTLLKTLAALNSQARSRVDCIIIENESSQFSAKEFAPFTHLNITYQKNSRNSIPQARNQAVDWAIANRYEWLAFIDDDAVPTSSWLKNLTHICNKKMVSSVAVIQGKCISLPKHNLYAQITQALYTAWIDHSLDNGRLETIDTKNCILRLNLFKTSGIRFDEKFAFASDLALAQQLRKSDYTILYDAGLVVEHLERHTLFAFLTHRYRTSLAFRKVKTFFPLSPTTSMTMKIKAVRNLPVSAIEKMMTLGLLGTIYAAVWLHLGIEQLYSFYRALFTDKRLS